MAYLLKGLAPSPPGPAVVGEPMGSGASALLDESEDSTASGQRTRKACSLRLSYADV